MKPNPEEKSAFVEKHRAIDEADDIVRLARILLTKVRADINPSIVPLQEIKKQLEEITSNY